MKKYEPYKGYVCEVDLDEIERKYVLPLNDESKREIALANIAGCEAYINLETAQVIIMPYVHRARYVVDENGHLQKKKHRLTKKQQKIHSDIREYMANQFWEHVATCEPDSYDEYDTQESVISCMENFLKCLPEEDERIPLFQDILRSNPEPAQELIYNIRRLNMEHLWERHYLVWKIAELDESLLFYRRISGEMRDLDNYISSSSDDDSDLPF